MSARKSGKVVITLSSRGGEALRKELIALGPAGEKALRRIDRAAKPVKPGLKAVDAAAREAGRGFDDMASRAGPAGRILTTLGPAGKAAAIGIGAIALAGAGALKMARDAVRDFDKMAKSADDLALHTDTFQALRLQAQKASIDFNKVEASMRQFVRASAEASTGRGEFTEKLKLSHPELIKQIVGLETTEEKLDAVAEALRNAKSEQEKTLISTAAFGESGRAMIRVLGDQESAIQNMVAEARQMGFIIEESVLRNAEEMETKIGLASTAIDLQFKSALIDLAPILVATAEKFAILATGANKIYQATKKFEDKSLAAQQAEIIKLTNRYQELTAARDEFLRKLNKSGKVDIAATNALQQDEPGRAGYFVKQNGKQSSRQPLFDIDYERNKIRQKLQEAFAAAPSETLPHGGGPAGATGETPADPGMSVQDRAKLMALVAGAQGRATTAAEKLKNTLEALDKARQAGIITSDAQLAKLKASERALAGRAEAQKRAAEAARAQAEQDRIVANIVAATLSPQEKYTSELEKLDAVRSRLSDGQYAAAEAKLAAERDKALAALAEKNRLQARAAELVKILGQITEAVITPQEKYNRAVAELNAMKPYLTVDQYAAALKREKAALKESNKEAARKLDLTRQLSQIRQSIKTDEELYQDEVDRLDKLRESATNPDGLSDQEYARAIQRATEQYRGLNQEANRHVDVLDQIVRGIAGQEGAWEQLGETALRILIEIAAKAIFAKEQVAGAENGGGLSDILGAIFGGSSGEIDFGSIFGGGGNDGFTPPIVPPSGKASALPPSSKAGAMLVGALPIPAGITAPPSAANDKQVGPTQLTIKNYGKPATAEVEETIDAQGIRHLEIRMFEIGKQSAQAAIADGSADTAMARRFNVTPKPGPIG